MKHVQRSVLLHYSPREMYDLVVAVEDYPKFLPWCDRAEVLERRPDGITARLSMAFAGVRQSFTTRNQNTPGERMVMTLVDGPFSKLEGDWTFQPVGDGTQTACRVGLELRYGFSSLALGAVVGPVFDRIAGSLVDAFVKRAEQVYGG